MYKIVRMYSKMSPRGGHLTTKKRTIMTGLTLEEAQTHCKSPETSSETCTTPSARAVTRRWGGRWFDGCEEN